MRQDRILRQRKVQKTTKLLQNMLLEGQSHITAVRRKKVRRGKLRKPLLRHRHKRGIYRKWKMGGITKEVRYLQK